MQIAPRTVTTKHQHLIWWYCGFLMVAALVIWKGGDALKQRQITELRIETFDQLNQLGSVLESAIAKYQHMPTLLAANDRVKRVLLQRDTEDVAQLNRELEQINRITEASDSYIIDRDGWTVAASNHSKADTFIGQNFAFRPYFQQAMEGRAGRYYALGTTSNRRGYFFSYPVWEGDSILGVAVVKIELEPYEKRFRNQSYEFVLLDPDLVIFGSSRPQWLYKTLDALSADELNRIAQSMRYKDQSISQLPLRTVEVFDSKTLIVELLEETRTVQHKEPSLRNSYLKMSRPIQLLGFQLAILAPMKGITEEITRWRAFAAGGVIIVALALAVAFLRTRMLKERSVANEISRHNQAYIREVIQNTQAGLITLDQHQRIEAFNPAIEKLVGHTLQPFVGAMLDELFLADSPEQAASMLRHSFTDRRLDIITLEGCLMYQGEPIKTVEMTLCHMQLPSSQKYLVTFHDMTERKRYEHEIKQASLILEQRVNERTYELQQANQRLRQEIQQHEDTQRELIQTAKLAVLGQLSAGINHELNQPLTAIRAFADNALTFLQRGNLAKVEGNLHQISQLGIHMGDIIARFKVFARKGDIRQGAVSVQHAIQVAAGIIESRLRENTIQLRLPVAEGLMIKGDMVFLEQVLVNLLANAVDAIVEADPQAMSPRQIHVAVHLAPDGRELTISVRDSGVGLSEQAQQHLFEPFFTSKSHSTGLGLGLSISQRIVELMGGRIYAQNHAQGGAEFCVVLQSMPVDAPKVG